MGLLLLSACNETNQPVQSLDLTSNVSPWIASELAIPSPTPRPPAETVVESDLFKVVPISRALLASGDVVTHQLNGTAAGLGDDDTYIDEYTFTAKQGQQVQLSLRSAAFDSFLALADSSGKIITYNDDDGRLGETGDAQITYYLPKDDTYRIWASSFEVGEGEYTLSLQLVDQPQPHDIASWDAITNTPVDGWLVAGDTLDEGGLFIDRWTITMPDQPYVLWMSSAEFDPYLTAYAPDGARLVANGDLDRIGREFDARLILEPTDTLPAGTTIELQAGLQGAFAVGGAYQLTAQPLPTDFSTRGTVIVRPVIVAGTGVTTDYVETIIQRADDAWDSCGIDVVIADEGIQTTTIDSVKKNVEVIGQTWTEHEQLLINQPVYTSAYEGVITTYIVKSIDDEQRYGIAYPSTRYAPNHSGWLMLSEKSVNDTGYHNTLAHEIGHILGLNHPDQNDGDSNNDTRANLMFTTEGLDEELKKVHSNLTPLQCVVARSTPHFVHADQPLVPAVFNRTDKLLSHDQPINGSLITRDATTEEDQFIDVYYFTGAEGDNVTIDLVSEQFDAFLLLDAPNGERIVLDNNSGDGSNAKISVTLPQSGDYTVGVSSFAPIEVGEYHLQLTQ